MQMNAWVVKAVLKFANQQPLLLKRPNPGLRSIPPGRYQRPGEPPYRDLPLNGAIPKREPCLFHKKTDSYFHAMIGDRDLYERRRTLFIVDFSDLEGVRRNPLPVGPVCSFKSISSPAKSNQAHLRHGTIPVLRSRFRRKGKAGCRIDWGLF